MQSLGCEVSLGGVAVRGAHPVALDRTIEGSTTAAGAYANTHGGAASALRMSGATTSVALPGVGQRGAGGGAVVSGFNPPPSRIPRPHVGAPRRGV